MIVIKKDKLNKIALTLTEKSELANPTYLFRFIEQQENKSYSFIAQDISGYPARINLFYITESPNPVLLNGVVSLPIGNYYYEIYEQESTTNLDHTNASKLLELGKVRVRGEEEEIKEYDGEETENIAYDEKEN